MVEKTAAVVHEEYIKKVQEQRIQKKEDEAAKSKAVAQENMIRTFTKKPTVLDAGHDDSVFGNRKNSSHIPTPLG